MKERFSKQRFYSKAITSSDVRKALNEYEDAIRNAIEITDKGGRQDLSSKLNSTIPDVREIAEVSLKIIEGSEKYATVLDRAADDVEKDIGGSAKAKGLSFSQWKQKLNSAIQKITGIRLEMLLLESEQNFIDNNDANDLITSLYDSLGGLYSLYKRLYHQVKYQQKYAKFGNVSNTDMSKAIDTANNLHTFLLDFFKSARKNKRKIIFKG